jgi:hypothetical protein
VRKVISTKLSLLIEPSSNSAVISKTIFLFTRVELLTSIKSCFSNSDRVVILSGVNCFTSVNL